MAVAVDQINTTPATILGNAALNLTTSTVGAGANRALVAYLCTEASASAPAAFWDSTGTNQSMTLLASQVDTLTASKIWVFGLVAPTSGAHTMRATWTGAADALLASACFTGADQTGGATTFKTNVATGASGAASQAVTSAVGDWTLGVYSSSGTAFTATNKTAWWNNSTLSINTLGASATGAATVTYTTTASAVYAFVGVDIAAVAAAASQVPYQPNYQRAPVQAQ